MCKNKEMFNYNISKINLKDFYDYKRCFDSKYIESMQQKCKNFQMPNNELGTTPFDITVLYKLANIKPKTILSAQDICPYIVSIDNSGSTSIVYRLQISNNISYAVKIPMDKNDKNYIKEIINRCYMKDKHIDSFASTIYISEDFIVSEWITGVYIKRYTGLNKNIIYRSLMLMLTMEENGIYEWDLNLRNILYDSCDSPRLFDYGDIFQFDPKTSVNPFDPIFSNFSLLERYHNCHILRYLVRLERINKHKVAFDNYKLYVSLLSQILDIRGNMLRNIYASDDLIKCNDEQLRFILEIGIGKSKASLAEVYIIDKFVSYITTIEDSIAYSIFDDSFFLRISETLALIRKEHLILNKYRPFFDADKDLSFSEIIDKYEYYRSIYKLSTKE